MNQELYHVSANPHVRDKVTTQKLMLYVILALLPTTIVGFVNFGLSAVINVAVTTATCVIAEYVWQKLMHKKITIMDLSAALTGLLLGMNLSSQTPVWIAAIGSVVAIIVVKQMFGGLGFNFANPAMTARIVLLVSFAGQMSNYVSPIDAVTTATPLANNTPITLKELFFGMHSGEIGET